MIDLGPVVLLRPAWLWALVPLAVLAVGLWRRQRARDRWRELIAPHLLEHLVVVPAGRSRFGPGLLLLVWGVAVTAALAGPAWRRTPPPFVEDASPMVIAIDCSRSMLAEDVRPSRLERAKQKTHDLLATRKGAKTALVAYAGTAHTVLPLTDDPDVLGAFVDSLGPEVMPRPGKEPAAAVALAASMLDREVTPGTIVLVADTVPATAAAALAEVTSESTDQIVVLAVATEGGAPVPDADGRPGELSRLDREALRTVESAGAWVTTFTVDDTDIERIGRRVERHLQSVLDEAEASTWKDDGVWGAWIALLLAGLWWRRGWVVSWE